MHLQSTLTCLYWHEILYLMSKKYPILLLSLIIIIPLWAGIVFVLGWDYCYSGKICVLGNSVVQEWQMFFVINLPFLIYGLILSYFGFKEPSKSLAANLVAVISLLFIVIISIFSLIEISSGIKRVDISFDVASFNQTYLDSSNGVSFKYPTSVKIEDWGKEHGELGLNLRFYSNTISGGFSLCSLSSSTNSSFVNPDSTITFNGIEWQKKLFYRPGWNYGFDGYRWQTRTNNGQYLFFQTDLLSDKWCEAIISTFKFTN